MKHVFMALMCGALMFGCDSDDDDNDNGGGGDGAAVNCQSRCEEKLATCPALAAQAAGACGGACDGTTESELTCLEGKSCDQISSGDTADCSSGSNNNNNNNGGGDTNLSCDCTGDGQVNVSGTVECNGVTATTCDQACECLRAAGG